jgi:WD40 repeat protein
VRFLADGKLAWGTFDHRVAFLDAAGRTTGRRPLDGGLARVLRLAVDRAGRWVAVGWTDDRVELFDAAHGVRRLSLPAAGHLIALSTDGSRLALVRTDRTIELHPTEGSGPAIILARPPDWPEALAFSPDGLRLGAALGRTAEL